MKKLTLNLSYAFILAGLGVLIAIALSDQESPNLMEVDDTQLQILYAIRENFREGTTTAVIAEETGIDSRTVMEECEYLADRNFIKIKEWGLNGHLIKITSEAEHVLKRYYPETKPKKVTLTNQTGLSRN
jgi:DNA-binding Lrp family transcriptional regulator